MGRVGGVLTFKGDDKKPKKKKNKKKKVKTTPNESNDSSPPAAAVAAARSSSSSSSFAAAAQRETRRRSDDGSSNAVASPPRAEKGTGRVTSSGTVLTGHGTRFGSELGAGDAVVVRRAAGGGRAVEEEEMRVVTMRLSDSSCGLSSAFSEDLRTPTAFFYVRAPRNEAAARDKERRAREETARETARTAFGIYTTTTNNATSNDHELVYREKTSTGSYVIRREKLAKEESGSGDGVTRGRLLELRTKKKSDRYC